MWYSAADAYKADYRAQELGTSPTNELKDDTMPTFRLAVMVHGRDSPESSLQAGHQGDSVSWFSTTGRRALASNSSSFHSGSKKYPPSSAFKASSRPVYS